MSEARIIKIARVDKLDPWYGPGFEYEVTFQRYEDGACGPVVWSVMGDWGLVELVLENPQ